MTPADHYLVDLAHQAGVTIEYTPLHGRDGEYLHARKIIRLRPGMHARLHRSVLAHELGHAAFGDTPSRFGPVNTKHERRAEEWGALRLIDINDYRHLEELHRGHAGAIALDLGVMRSTVEAFRNLLLRTDTATYIRPRMGAGQHDHRIEASP
ncbi:MAG: ImmA/IrrE family metallo-endopeptidase [Microbacterium sp.]